MSVALKAPGHIHVDRSRERRSNSGKSEDSSLPKIKTPSNHEEDELSVADKTLTKCTINDVQKPSSRDQHVKKFRKKSRNLVPPERKKRQLSEDQSRRQPQETWVRDHHPPSDSDIGRTEHHNSKSIRSPVTNKSTSMVRRSVSSSDLRKIRSDHHDQNKSISLSPDNRKTRVDHDKETKKTSRSDHDKTKKISISPDGSVGSNHVKRSISITLPNKLNHKIRRRVSTSGTDGQENRELRIRSGSRPQKGGGRVRAITSTGKTSEEQYSLFHDLGRGTRSKHLSQIEKPAKESNLQDLLSHFTEIERRNRATSRHRNRDLHPSRTLGLQELVERHRSLNSTALNPHKGETKGRSVDDYKEQRREERRQARRMRRREEGLLDEHFSKMKIEAIYNSGVPDNHCSVSTPASAVVLSQSESDQLSDPPTTRVAATKAEPRRPVSQKRGHLIRSSRPRTVEKTKPVNQDPDQEVPQVTKPAKQAASVELRIHKRRSRDRRNTENNAVGSVRKTGTREHKSSLVTTAVVNQEHQDLDADQNETPDKVVPEKIVPEKVDDKVDPAEDDCSYNSNIVKMLKMIDKQGLKKRLSLDKLDCSLDTDDESHLDRMLESITTFVEDKIKRRRYKTGPIRSRELRFGPCTVHVYDPMVLTEPFDVSVITPTRGILKTRTGT